MGAGRYSTPSGVLVGHAEGITYVTSKGDNRYLASNGKDQKMLLWDLRMMHSSRDYSKLPKTRDSGFDYRSDQYRGHKATKIPVRLHVQQQWQGFCRYIHAHLSDAFNSVIGRLLGDDLPRTPGVADFDPLSLFTGSLNWSEISVHRKC